jgi:hypothetical protein
MSLVMNMRMERMGKTETIGMTRTTAEREKKR